MRRAFRVSCTGFTGLMLAALLSAPGTLAWGNGGYSSNPDYPDYGTHDWVADKALAFQTADVTFLLTTYHSDFLIGTEAPDNDAYIGDSFNHHVYFTSGGALQTDIGASRARTMYASALAALKASDYAQAAYFAGAMAHYVADVGAYSHTMGSGSDWGTSPNHSAYEDHVNRTTKSLAAPQATALAWNDAYNATLSLARLTTFGAGPVKANTWMEANYDWDDPDFVSSCLASLNESVKAVASALGLLMFEGGALPIPEFWLGGCLLLVSIAVPFSLLVTRRRIG